MTIPEQRLARLLFLVGAMCLLALPTVLLPVRWMAGVHEWLGMGKFPERPITIYLARSTSALCGFYGLVLVALSRDVVRFAPLVTLQAISIAILATGAMIMMWDTGMPLWWTATDAAGAILFGSAALWLQRQAAREQA